MLNHIVSIILVTSLFNPASPEHEVLSSFDLSLANRQPVAYVNDVFRYNILRTLDLMGTYQFTLPPGQTFAFHEDVLPKYQGKVTQTTKAHFNYSDGFKSDGYLMGDGVCHLASLINMVAQQAGLTVEVPANHNFAVIPDIPKEYGVSIYYYPGRAQANAQQNLYITNNKNYPVQFKFEYVSDKLKLEILEIK